MNSKECYEYIKNLEEEVEKLRDHIWTLSSYSEKAYEYWDSDRDSKTGKMLLAMSGELPGYSETIDKILEEACPSLSTVNSEFN